MIAQDGKVARFMTDKIKERGFFQLRFCRITIVDFDEYAVGMARFTHVADAFNYAVALRNWSIV